MELQVEQLTRTFGTVVLASGGQRISELDFAEIAKLYMSSGAVLFRGFKATTSEFVSFSTHLLVPMEHPVRSPDNAPGFRGEIVYDVDPNKSGGDRSLHAEASDTSVKLGMCCFFCRKAPPIGGETTLGDGVEILERLSDST